MTHDSSPRRKVFAASLSLFLICLFTISACGDGGSSTNAKDDEGATVGSGDGGSGAGVGGGRAGVGGTPNVNAITWHQHIAPLVAEKCGGCHADGGIAPFSITTYEDARTWAGLMEREILNGSMPPWGAQETDECTPPGRFKDDIRLSDSEKAIFSQWIVDGLVEGDPSDATALPEPPSVALDDPARQLTIPSAVVVEGTRDAFVCFTLDPELVEQVWLTGSQVTAGNPEIVHHALVYRDRDNQGAELADENGQYPCFGGPGLSNTSLVAAWAPGAAPAKLPTNAGLPLQPGEKLVIQVHYHPTGKGEEIDDSTRIDLQWTTEEPDYVAAVLLIGNFATENSVAAGGEGFGLTTGPDFLIPAGVKDHVEVNKFFVDDGGNPLARTLPLSLWMVGSHMHYVGIDMKISASDTSGKDECLLQTPNWDFNWQRGYAFEGEVTDLPAVYPGDTLTLRCTYDNSLENPSVRNALDDQGLSEPVDVQLGEETLDEMCLGVFGLAVPKEFASFITP